MLLKFKKILSILLIKQLIEPNKACSSEFNTISSGEALSYAKSASIGFVDEDDECSFTLNGGLVV